LKVEPATSCEGISRPILATEVGNTLNSPLNELIPELESEMTSEDAAFVTAKVEERMPLIKLAAFGERDDERSSREAPPLYPEERLPKES
jgi:hypothetical protein